MIKSKLLVVCLITLITFIGLNELDGQTSFTTGNLVVLRVGDGSASLTNASTALFLEEITPNGSMVQTFPVPVSGSNVLTNSGSATSEGQITRSPDGYYITLAGYNAAAGTSSIVGTTSGSVNRKLLKVDHSFGLTPVLSATAYNANNIRSGVCSGDDYWAAGTSGTSGANGIQYFGMGTGGQVSATITNTRVVNIFNGQLYFSTGSSPVGIYSVGSGLPVTSGQTSTLVIAGTGSNPSPYAFSFNPSSTVCYVADDRTSANGGGVQKFVYSGGSWSLAYTLLVGTTGARGLTVDWSGTHPVIYATTTESNANRLVKITDSVSGAPFTLLATSATNTAFRGVAFAPAEIPCDTYSTTTINAYSAYTWNGTTYTAPGTYTDTTTNAAGCDSIATLILNFINYPLQILHSSDFEASTDAVQDAPRFAAIVDSLENTHPNSITLSSGDNFIPSPFSFSGEDPRMVLPYRTSYGSYYNTTLNNPPYDLRAGIARADISILNYIGVEASVLGNHDFDFGTPELRNIIGGNISGSNVRWFGAQFPYLSSNLNFTADPNMSPVFTPVRQLNTAYSCTPANTPAQISAKKKLAPYCYLNENGEKIGVVGVTTPMLASISSPGATTVKNPGAGTNDMTLLAGIVQPYIDSLINLEGCNKIILLSHLQQLAFEKDLATKLHGVDIIIAGGSHTLMADSTDRLRTGDVAIENYPYLTAGNDGKPIAIINTDGNYKYVGRLVVEFTPAGEIVPASINPSVSGAYPTDSLGLQEVWGANAAMAFAPGSRGYRVKLLCDSIGSAILAKDGNLFGKTSVFLEGRRNFVRTEETNLGNLSAEANLWMAKFYDNTTTISIKNGGGIRSIIGYIQAWGDSVVYYPPQANPAAGKQEGDISQLDIENSLRFNNLLSLLTVDAAGLRRTLEHGVSATAPGATPGQFPQIAGVRFSFNPTLPVFNPATGTGGRIVTAVITNDSGTVILDTLIMNGALYGNPARTFRLVTLNFLAGGGDSYPFPIVGSNRIDINTVLPVPPTVPGVANFTTAGSEQDAFAEYTKTLHSTSPYQKEDTPVAEDYRIQNLTQRADHVLPIGVTFTKTNVTCFGLSNGTATAIPLYTTGSVTYLWSNAQTTATITNLAAGMYSVTVTDSTGATATGSVTITQPDVLNASSSAGSIACAGGTATVTVSATGGTMPYTGTGTFSVPAGTHTFVVTDANGCTASTSVTITEPELFSWKSTQTSTNGAEISAFDPQSKRVFTIAGPAVEYRTLSNTGILTGLTSMPFGFTPPAGTTAVPNSVDVRNGIVAVSFAIVGASNAQQPGRVAFYNAATATYISDVTVGYLPDMVSFSPDGTKVLTADEAEANSYGQPTSFNPEGSVSIIDVSGGFAAPTVTIAGFSAWNSQMTSLKNAGVRIYGPGATVAQDLEPEYLTYSSDGSKAFVTLQENNAVGELDIATATFTAIHPLGLKDHSLPGNGLDASDQDGPGGTKKINIQNWPVKGMYQPDAITRISVNGNDYFLTANEGDSRDFTGYSEEIRVSSSSYVLDPTVFPNATTLKLNANLGRLQLSKATGDIDHDGDFDEIHALGARSFTIWNSSFSPVFDSQDQLEQITALRSPASFNSDGTSSSFDTRSDNKGPEPEAVTTGNVNGILFAVVGSERTGDLFVYDITNPLTPQFRQYINTPADLGVEGVIFVPAEKSPTGKALIISTAEVSKTVSVFEFSAAPVITLIGNDTVEVVQNATYTDEGATAVDRNGNNITGSINTVSNVNTAVPGTYSVTYTVTDACGIPAIPVIRTVIVTPLIPASIIVTDTIGNGEAACFNATQTITIGGAAGPFLIQNGGSAEMIAGETIHYLPGTVVELGGYMHGYIAPGGPWCGAKSTSVVSTVETGDTKWPVMTEQTTRFTLYPNPTDGRFTIEQKDEATYQTVTIDVYSMQGNIVLTTQRSGERSIQCTLEGKPAGLYQVRVNADGKISVFKMILTR